MKSSIILEYYQTLSKVKLNRFTDFVESPYYTKHEATKKLHYYLLKETQKDKSQNLDKKTVFKKVFSNIKYNEQKLKNTITLLLDLFELFMATEALKNDKNKLRELNIKESLNRNLLRNTKKNLKKAFNEKEKNITSQSDAFYHTHVLNDLAHSFEELYGNREKSSQYLQKRLDSLDQFYFSEKMLTGAAMLNREKILKTTFSKSFFEEVKQHCIKDEGLKAGSVNLNLSLYQLIETEDDLYFNNLKESINNIVLTKNELNLYYSFLRNFAIRKINAGDQSFLKELFQLNESLIAKDLLIHNNNISEWTYKNFISLGIRLKKFEWTEKFIKNYSNFLDHKIYENAYNFNFSNLLYAQERYDEAMQYLLYINYTDVMYLLDSKALLLKIYYETNEFEALDSLLHSFRLLTMRQSKISSKQRKTFLNLIKITSLILSLKIKKSTLSKEKVNEEKEKLNKKIITIGVIANKTWVLEKLNEI